MQTMVPLYGFGGGGGTGASLTVNAPAGCTVTVSKDGKTKTKTAGADGVAVFRGLATGQWTVNMTDGVQTAPAKTADITADYAITMSFFSATIHVTYPAGSTCTATDGVTTLTAPDTSGTWDCVVPNAGVWTVSLDSGFAEAVEVTTNGETYMVDKWYLYNRGDEHTSLTGGWSNSGWKQGNSTTLAPVKNSDNIQVITNSSNYPTVAGVSNAIKLSGFSKISVKAIIDQHGIYGGILLSCDLEVSMAKTVNISSNTIASVSMGAASTSIVQKDIALDNTVDYAYVGIYSETIRGNKGRFFEIWLEV